MRQIPHLSFSSIEHWMNCPASWWFNYVLGEKLPAGSAAAFGKTYEELVTHQLLPSQAEKPKLDPENPEHAEIIKAAETYFCWGRAWGRADEAQKKIEITPDQWSNYADLYGVDSEIPVPLIGFTDLQRRMDDGIRLEILDLKTSGFSGFKAAWAVQLTLYAMAERAYQVSVHQFVKTKTPKLEAYTWVVGKPEIAWMMTYIDHAAKQIAEALERDDVGSLPRTPGRNAMQKHCDYCPRQIDCVARILTTTMAQN